MPHDDRQLTIQARLTTTEGKGVGRWRTYYRAEGLAEVSWWIRDLVKSAQMRVLDGREVVVAPIRVGEYLEAHPWRSQSA